MGLGDMSYPHSDTFLLRINSLRKIRQIQVILGILCKMQRSHRVGRGTLEGYFLVVITSSWPFRRGGEWRNRLKCFHCPSVNPILALGTVPDSSQNEVLADQIQAG